MKKQIFNVLGSVAFLTILILNAVVFVDKGSKSGLSLTTLKAQALGGAEPTNQWARATGTNYGGDWYDCADVFNGMGAGYVVIECFEGGSLPHCWAGEYYDSGAEEPMWNPQRTFGCEI